ncbi:hypothetical protein HDU76_008601 [Blyttiomyces sp. JEL0837]|nr:hypothetical protein HDU76_008601 [Blyttiomyces sp. JEL0837]
MPPLTTSSFASPVLAIPSEATTASPPQQYAHRQPMPMPSSFPPVPSTMSLPQTPEQQYNPQYQQYNQNPYLPTIPVISFAGRKRSASQSDEESTATASTPPVDDDEFMMDTEDTLTGTNASGYGGRHGGVVGGNEPHLQLLERRMKRIKFNHGGGHTHDQQYSVGTSSSPNTNTNTNQPAGHRQQENFYRVTLSTRTMNQSSNSPNLTPSSTEQDEATTYYDTTNAALSLLHYQRQLQQRQSEAQQQQQQQQYQSQLQYGNIGVGHGMVDSERIMVYEEMAVERNYSSVNAVLARLAAERGRAYD